MKEYEAVWEIFNSCANNQMRDVFFEELELEDPEQYILEKFKDKELKYEKSVQEVERSCLISRLPESGRDIRSPKSDPANRKNGRKRRCS